MPWGPPRGQFWRFFIKSSLFIRFSQNLAKRTLLVKNFDFRPKGPILGIFQKIFLFHPITSKFGQMNYLDMWCLAEIFKLKFSRNLEKNVIKVSFFELLWSKTQNKKWISAYRIMDINPILLAYERFVLWYLEFWETPKSKFFI